MEPQCGGFLAVNENLANMVPAVPVVLGAGGLAVDVDGRALVGRKVSQGRCTVLYAANSILLTDLLAVVGHARSLSNQGEVVANQSGTAAE